MSLAFCFGTERCRAATACVWLVCCIGFGAGQVTELAVAGDRSGNEGQTLYNGIRLPSPWPPQQQSLSLEPKTPPYIVSPPEVITIDLGRQLFVDDFLTEHTTLSRTFHLPEYHPASPVLKPDRPWEHEKDGQRQGPFAMPFSGGVWYDPQDGLFKMWYHADYGNRHLCLATSRDGIRWEKPSLDVVPGTNIVFPRPGAARVVWLDLDERNPARRFKLIVTRGGEDLIGDNKWYGSKGSMYVHVSHDGIHWSESLVRTGPTGDRNSAFWNPFRERWVYSIREYSPIGGLSEPKRCRRYWESPDLIAGVPWQCYEPPMWVGSDNHDLRRPTRNIQPELYNLDAAAYESVLLGLFVIMRDFAHRELHRPKINEVCVGFSRDGFHWRRPDRRSFCPVSERQGDWNWGNVQSVGGCCLVVRDKLYFYVSGRKGNAPHFHDAGGSTGLAVLRRDGFASMDASGTEGVLITRPVRFRGKHLFVNVDAPKGQLQVEILDQDGEVIKPFTKVNCAVIRADNTLTPVKWQDVEDLSAVNGKPVRFRFHLRNGRLYSFWVSLDKSGSSRGYVAAGGPGFTGSTDTVGIEAYR